MENSVQEGFSVKLVMVAGGLIILVVVAFLISRLFVTIGHNTVHGLETEDNTKMVDEIVAQRVKRVGTVIAGKVDTKPKVYTGEQVVEMVCASCHRFGVLGSPKIGSKEAWEPRWKQGFDVLTQHALEGKGKMPAKGGNPMLSDVDVQKAIAFMLDKSGLEAPDLGAKPEAGAEGEPAQTAPLAEAQPAVTEEAAAAPASAPQQGMSGMAPAAAMPPQGMAGMMPPGSAPTAPSQIMPGTLPPVASPPMMNMMPNTQSEPTIEAQPLPQGTPAPASAGQDQTAMKGSPATARNAQFSFDLLAFGKDVYTQACSACHAAGIAGAPRMDDPAAWAPRLNTTMDALAAAAVNGKGAMPPKGGRYDLSNEAVMSAVAYMVSTVR